MSILDHAKEVATLVKAYGNQELYQKIVDLRDEIFELREENLQLKEEVRAFKFAADISGELTRDGNQYFRVDQNGVKSGPFCLACGDYEKKLVNVTRSKRGVITIIRCNICDARKGAGIRSA